MIFIGAKVKLHYEYWHRALRDWPNLYEKWVLLTGIKFGFPVHTRTTRRPSSVIPNVNPKLSSSEWKALNSKVLEWLEDTYIEILGASDSAIFHPAYVIPKRNGGFRPILNLSWPKKSSVNDGISNIFRTCVLPQPQDVMNLVYSVAPNGFCACVDLKDAWKQFEILPAHRKFFGWSWEGLKVVETRFPFGWSEAVRNFGMLAVPVFAFWF